MAPPEKIFQRPWSHDSFPQ